MFAVQVATIPTPDHVPLSITAVGHINGATEFVIPTPIRATPSLIIGSFVCYAVNTHKIHESKVYNIVALR